jgi:hypothetical protein
VWEKGRRVKFGKMEEGLRVAEKGQGHGCEKRGGSILGENMEGQGRDMDGKRWEIRRRVRVIGGNGVGEKMEDEG